MKPQLTLEAFAEFCEGKPAGDVYNWADFENCACGQYATSLGIPISETEKFNGEHTFWYKAQWNAMMVSPRTFGALATRLRAAL